MQKYSIRKALLDEVKASPGRSFLSMLQTLGILSGVFFITYYRFFPQSTSVDLSSVFLVKNASNSFSGELTLATTGSEGPVREVHGYMLAIDAKGRILDKKKLDYVGFYPLMSAMNTHIFFNELPEVFQVCVNVTNTQGGHANQNILVEKETISDTNVFRYSKTSSINSVKTAKCSF